MSSSVAPAEIVRTEIVGEGDAKRPTNMLLVPLWVIGLLVPVIIGGLYIPIDRANPLGNMPGAVLYVYITSVGQSYRLVAGGLNLYAYFMGKPLLALLGPQPTPDLDFVIMFFIDFTVGVSAVVIAATFTQHPLFWGALLFWVCYGWLDHVFAGYRLYFLKRFGPYPRVLLGKLGFEVFAATSVFWQGSNLVVMMLSKDVHRYFGIIYPGVL